MKEQKTCERCHLSFECNSENISDCLCSSVSINAAQRSAITGCYKDCLCINCLKELQSSGLNVNTTLKVPFIILCCLFMGYGSAQTYAPPVGSAGTTAMHKDSIVFIDWASNCIVDRGYQDVSNVSLGKASVGDATMATGKALSNGVVSLGDGGSAICSFIKPIKNGPGFDFAVFENSIDDTFLELAFVEVSSDGTNFFRFPSHSLTDTVIQTGGFDPTDAKKLNNLAGKYRAGYGTPFDLQQLSSVPGLDINSVTHVKIIDVIGSINNLYASRDSYNNKINDPWPTPFPSSGFDLDAIGIIYQNTVTAIGELENNVLLSVYPNPVNLGKSVNVTASEPIKKIRLLDNSAKLLFETEYLSLDMTDYSVGIYFLEVEIQDRIIYKKLLVF